jgi:hypothetical protein
MLDRQFHGLAPDFSATSALQAIADVLTDIKRRDQLTDGAIGDALHKSPDRVRDYRLADSDMGLVTFLRAVRRWGEDMNPVLALAGYRLTRSERADTCDIAKGITLASALHRVLDAVRDGKISGDELAGMADEITDAGAVMDELRSRLAEARA